MSVSIGKHAVVVGAGMGGLAAAKALSAHFDQVTVLDRDALPSTPQPRQGTPQSRHPHALLLSGQNALEKLCPNFASDLEAAGAVKMRVGVDLAWERPGFDPFPIRDLGFDNFFMSRPLLEFVTRKCVDEQHNVALLSRRRVTEIVASPDRVAVTGVHFEDAEGRTSTLHSDLVVDASGRGALTHAVLESLGLAKPEETEIGIDIAYATTVFDVPQDAPSSWKGVVTLPQAPEDSRGAFLFPMENRRWIVGLGSAHGDTLPGDIDGYMAILKGLRTTSVHDAVKGARRIGEIVRFGFPSSVRRRFERLETFPPGLIPIGDAVCRFNPIFGQGMSVAAMEACVLDSLLEQRCGLSDPLDGLAQAFFADIQPLLDTPWRAAENDFVYPQTRGDRPPDMERRFRYSAALLRLAAEDPLVHKILVEVNSLLKPSSALREPEIADRVMDLMNVAA
jgi:2-polyprenyl-6-methoxyphenol hydroxylase-like FAD-dependent oxidoreductase